MKMNKIVCCILGIAMATACDAVLAWQAGGANGDYRIVLTRNMGGLDIATQTANGAGAMVGLTNHSGKTVLCTASFADNPALNMYKTRRVILAAGERATLAYPAMALGGIFSTAYINVKCAEIKSDNGKKDSGTAQSLHGK